MKFLSAHGEKLFLLLVLGIGGWSVHGSFTSLQSGTLLPPKARVLLKNIVAEHNKKVPPPPRELTYADRLEGTLRLAGPDTGPQFKPWMGPWEPPREGGTEYVQGRLGVPGGVKAKGGRGRATLSWSAPSPLEYVRIVTYEVFKWKKGEQALAEPTFPAKGATLTDTSLVDEDVEADKTYLYKVRVVGAADPKEDNQFVERPEGTTQMVVDGEKRWVTEFSGELPATVFSNIEFGYIMSHAPFEVLTAVIRIKNWNAEKGDWDVYNTSPGIPQGEPINGYRVVGPKKILFESGYIFEDVGEYVKEIKTGERWVWVQTPEGHERVKKDIIRRVTIHFMVVRKDGTELTRKVVKKSDLKHLDESERGSSTHTRIRIKPRRSKRKEEEETDEVDFGALREDMVGVDEDPAGPGGTRRAARTPARRAGPTAGMVDYEAIDQTNWFKVPASWTQVPGAFQYGDEANKALMKDFKVAYSGSRDDMMMIVQQVFDGGGPHGDGTEELVRGYAEALKKQTLAVFPQAELKADTSVMVGLKGRLLAYFTVTIKVGDRDLTVARYCGYTTKMMHIITFVCRSENYNALSATFLKVVGTVRW